MDSAVVLDGLKFALVENHLKLQLGKIMSLQTIAFKWQDITWKTA